MKRSDMLTLIREILEYTDKHDIVKYDLKAEMLLSAIEQFGMVPPAIPTNASGWEVGKGTPAYINKWESEEDWKFSK